MRVPLLLLRSTATHSSRNSPFYAASPSTLRLTRSRSAVALPMLFSRRIAIHSTADRSCEACFSTRKLRASAESKISAAVFNGAGERKIKRLRRTKSVSSNPAVPLRHSRYLSAPFCGKRFLLCAVRPHTGFSHSPYLSVTYAKLHLDFPLHLISCERVRPDENVPGAIEIVGAANR